MLAISQFHHEDVFPWTDGSIVRAAKLLSAQFYGNGTFNSEKGSPYRTYLALYFWKALDEGYWEK